MWVTLDIFQTFHRVYYIFICLNELMMKRLLKCCPNRNDVQLNSYVIGSAINLFTETKFLWKCIKQGIA